MVAFQQFTTYKMLLSQLSYWKPNNFCVHIDYLSQLPGGISRFSSIASNLNTRLLLSKAQCTRKTLFSRDKFSIPNTRPYSLSGSTSNLKHRVSSWLQQYTSALYLLYSHNKSSPRTNKRNVIIYNNKAQFQYIAWPDLPATCVEICLNFDVIFVCHEMLSV